MHTLPGAPPFSGQPTIGAWIAAWTAEVAAWWPSVGAGEAQVRRLLDWFDEMEVPDDATGRRAALADRVMTASKGIPLRAFNRLQREILWPPGD